MIIQKRKKLLGKLVTQTICIFSHATLIDFPLERSPNVLKKNKQYLNERNMYKHVHDLDLKKNHTYTHENHKREK